MEDQEIPQTAVKRDNRTWVVVLFIVVFFLLLGAGTSLYFFSKANPQQAVPVTQTPSVSMSPTTIPSPTASASATPSQEELSTLDIQVLNGSGRSGSAQQIAASLRTAGFTSVTVGNASSFGYEGITINVSRSAQQYLPRIRDAITSSYGSTNITTAIDESIASDAEVIVGQ